LHLDLQSPYLKTVQKSVAIPLQAIYNKLRLVDKIGYYTILFKDTEFEYEQFRNGVKKILLASDSFNIGINIEQIKNVITISNPLSKEWYYQETGRLSRDQKEGNAIAFITTDLVYDGMNVFNNLIPDTFEQLSIESKKYSLTNLSHFFDFFDNPQKEIDNINKVFSGLLANASGHQVIMRVPVEGKIYYNNALHFAFILGFIKDWEITKGETKYLSFNVTIGDLWNKEYISNNALEFVEKYTVYSKVSEWFSTQGVEFKTIITSFVNWYYLSKAYQQFESVISSTTMLANAKNNENPSLMIEKELEAMFHVKGILNRIERASELSDKASWRDIQQQEEIEHEDLIEIRKEILNVDAVLPVLEGKDGLIDQLNGNQETEETFSKPDDTELLRGLVYIETQANSVFDDLDIDIDIEYAPYSYITTKGELNVSNRLIRTEQESIPILDDENISEFDEILRIASEHSISNIVPNQETSTSMQMDAQYSKLHSEDNLTVPIDDPKFILDTKESRDALYVDLCDIALITKKTQDDDLPIEENTNLETNNITENIYGSSFEDFSDELQIVKEPKLSYLDSEGKLFEEILRIDLSDYSTNFKNLIRNEVFMNDINDLRFKAFFEEELMEKETIFYILCLSYYEIKYNLIPSRFTQLTSKLSEEDIIRFIQLILAHKGNSIIDGKNLFLEKVYNYLGYEKSLLLLTYEKNGTYYYIELLEIINRFNI